MNRSRFLSVLSSLALLGSAAGCGQSVHPEFLDGAETDGSADALATSTTTTTTTTTMPVCRNRAERDALYDQRCSVAGALLCPWDPCIELVCRPTRVIADGGFVETDELRWQNRTVCNGPLPPPELPS